MSCKIFHKGKYYVNIKRGFEDYKKDITIAIEKQFESDSLRLILSNDEDPSFLCILNLTRSDYEDLKKQQGLLIDFDNFPCQLVRLLQQCASNNMFLILLQTNPVQYYFEIVEHNEFKRLVHLSLKTGPATDSDIKQHMVETIVNLKKALSTLKSSSTSTEVIFNDKCLNFERKIQDLTHALSKMEEDKLRKEIEFQELMKQEKERMSQERLQWQKNMEMNTKAQIASTQENLNRKDKQIDELNTLCKQLKDNIQHLEYQLSEKSQRMIVLESEVQKSHIETATLKAKNATLEKDVLEREKQYNQLNIRCSFLEKSNKENSDVINDLNKTIQLITKEKASLEERLVLSESLANKNNEAAHSKSDQLLKANQIISKQNADLIEMKEKLLCRTAIALEQEKVIDRNSEEIEKLKTEISASKQEIDKLKIEINNFREKYESNEKALKERDETIKNNNLVIQWLHKKMEDNAQPAQSKDGQMNSSTPYFMSRRNTIGSSQDITEESINFYATSKLSNIESSPQVQAEDKPVKGLDPKYLKPVANEKQVKDIKVSMKDSAKSIETHNSKGKENKIFSDLPKVNYKEKKSSRPTTYRATPVSAYFP